MPGPDGFNPLFGIPGFYFQEEKKAKEPPKVIDEAVAAKARAKRHPLELNERSEDFLLPGVSAKALLEELKLREIRGQVCRCHKCVHKHMTIKLHMQAQADFDSCPHRDGEARRDFHSWCHSNNDEYEIRGRLIDE